MNEKFCPKCETIKPVSEFYKHDTRKDGLYGYCKTCFNTQNDQRRIDLKAKAILYKGGKCMGTGCDKSFPQMPMCIFDFHHRDPNTKGDWTSIRKHGWEKIKTEIDKCDLLCANCHRIVEYGAPTWNPTKN